MAKYKLIICDDAAIIRSNLRFLIKSQFPDVDVVGVYSDGDEALAHLQRESVDLLVVDIHMERVDGLQVCKYVYENNLPTKVIIITGYQEFEYAQKAINYHVSSLVTKPIDSEALIGAITGAMKEVDELRSRQMDDSQRSISDYRQISNALRLFIEGGLQLDPLWQDIRNFLKGRTALLLNYHLTSQSNPVPLNVWDDLIPLKTEDFEIYVLSCREKGACCLVISDMDSTQLRKAIQPAITDMVNGISYFHHGELLHTIVPVGDLSPAFSTELFGDFSAFLTGISEMNSEKLQIYTDRVSLFAETDTLRLMISLMLIYACTEVPTLNLEPFITALIHADHSVNAAALMQRFCKAILEAHASTDSFETVVRQYCYRNMGNTSLSLESVATRFGYSGGHFSRKFRQLTGDTFQIYLTNMRLERAKELLADPKNTVATVATQVGFKDPAYFARVFKKYTGHLPKEHKNHSAR